MTGTTQVQADVKAEKRDFRKEVTDSIVRMLEEGVAPWQKPWDSAGLRTPFNPNSGRPYRGGNALHLLAVGMKNGYADPRWMTYKQAAENGWQVRKGEKGTQIEFWDFSRTGTRASATPSDSASNEAATSEVSKPIHRVYTVFNAQQIDGIPEYQPKVHTPFEIAEAGEHILRNSGATIHHDQADRAFYKRSNDTIHLPRKNAFRDAAGYYGTALHELAHWTGHPTRLNRSTLTDSYQFGDLNYAKEELRAEIASVFIAAERGIPHDPSSHAAYVGSWIKALRDDKHEIFRAAQDASRAADFVLQLERDRALAEAVEVSAATRTEDTDRTLSPDELAARSTEGLAAAEEPIRREIANLDNDRDLAAEQQNARADGAALYGDGLRESSQYTARFSRDNGTVRVHDKKSGIDHRVPVSTGERSTQPGSANGMDQRSPDHDRLAASFDDARKMVSEIIGDTGRTVAALTSSGTYRGQIIGETESHLLQQISGHTVIAHMKHALSPTPQVGEKVVIAYSNSKAVVSEFHQRTRANQLER
jgi:antirestriction protein ArdC